MTPETYQTARKGILGQMEQLKQRVEDLRLRDPRFFSELPRETEQRFLHLDREITRLRHANLTVAFVGGFSAGKSSIVNAFLGRYLLPESTDVTTAVPTFVRATGEAEHAELSYLGRAEVELLNDLYRKELAETFSRPELANAPVKELLEAVKPLTGEGRGKKLVEYFEQFQEQRRKRDIPERGRTVNASLEDMQRIVRDESEAMFLDRVEVFVKSESIPPDVQLVDLPGVSVPNPRHRQLTYRFVTQDAHAVVFVLLATRLFDRDELDILQRIRAGETSISERTFWVLNRWDALSTQQREESLASFRAKMQEFAIPSNYVYFTTNALHGLLAQLAIRKEEVGDPKLASHQRDYLEAVENSYGGSHETAFTDSRIPELQRKVLDYLNNDLRATTLTAAVNNAEQNVCQPLMHHLRVVKEGDEQLVRTELDHRQNQEARNKTEQRFRARKEDLETCFRNLREQVAVNRANVFTDPARKVEESLAKEIESGKTTDAYETYKRIIADGNLRKFPYYFEIESKVVDSLNSQLKQRFRDIVRDEVSHVADQLTKDVKAKLEAFQEDVNYDPAVQESIQDVLQDGRKSFLDQVDGVVKDKAGYLDELLLYKEPSGFFGFFGSDNDIVEGLEKAAKIAAARLRDPQQDIRPEDMHAKTEQIRKTLKGRYIDQAAVFRRYVANAVWTIVIDEMQRLERSLLDRLNGKYRTLLEQVMQATVGREFADERKRLETRAKQFREALEEIQEGSQQMHTLLQGSVG